MLQFIVHKTNIIRCSGENIAPVEVEAVLQSHDPVPGIVCAYDATQLDATSDPTTCRLKLLWDSSRVGVAFTFSKFCGSLIADGRLLVPT